jgi:hypothetical protein
VGAWLKVISEAFLEGISVRNEVILVNEDEQAEHLCKYRGWRRTYHILSTISQAVRVVNKAKEDDSHPLSKGEVRPKYIC